MKERKPNILVIDTLDPWNRKAVLESQRVIDERLECELWDNFIIGKELTRIKAIVGHGNYEQFREETWGDRLKRSKAWYCKSIYAKYKDHPELVRSAPTTFLVETINRGFPEEIINSVIEHLNELDKKDYANICREFQNVKKGQTTKDDFITRANSVVIYKAKKSLETDQQSKRLRDQRLAIENFKANSNKGVSIWKEIKTDFMKIEDANLDQIVEHRDMLIKNYREAIDLLEKSKGKTSQLEGSC
jgi:hypothetical protein